MKKTKVKGHIVTWEDAKGKMQYKFFLEKIFAEHYTEVLSRVGRVATVSNEVELEFPKQ